MKKIILLSMMLTLSSPIFAVKIHTIFDEDDLKAAEKYIKDSPNNKTTQWWINSVTNLLQKGYPKTALFFLDQAFKYVPQNQCSQILKTVFTSIINNKNFQNKLFKGEYLSQLLGLIQKAKNNDITIPKIYSKLQGLLKKQTIIKQDPFYIKFVKDLVKYFVPGVIVFNQSGQNMKVMVLPGVEKEWTEIKKGEKAFLKIEKKGLPKKREGIFASISPQEEEEVIAIVGQLEGQQDVGKDKIKIRWKSSNQKEDIYWESPDMDMPGFILLRQQGRYDVDPKAGMPRDIQAGSKRGALVEKTRKLFTLIREGKSEKAKTLASEIRFDFDKTLRKALEEFDLAVAIWIFENKPPEDIKIFKKPFEDFIKDLSEKFDWAEKIKDFNTLTNLLYLIQLFDRKGLRSKKTQKKQLIAVRDYLRDEKLEKHAISMDNVLVNLGIIKKK
ncbi:hypothetical protein ACFLYA_01280 [Candidatus Dependentiae bacterium]